MGPPERGQNKVGSVGPPGLPGQVGSILGLQLLGPGREPIRATAQAPKVVQGLWSRREESKKLPAEFC